MNTYSVLNTIAALAADITLVGRKLNVAITSVTGTPTFPTLDYINIVDEKTQAAVTEVLQTETITYVAANATKYRFSITQMVDGVLQSAIITYDSDASGTDAEIGQAIVDQVNAHTELRVTASNPASPVLLTAQAGYPTFTVAGATNVTPLVTLAGVAAQGQGTTLAANGIVGAEAGQVYTKYEFSYNSDAGVQMQSSTLNGGNTHTLYVKEGAANFAAFNTRMGEVVNAFLAGTTDADPAAVAVN